MSEVELTAIETNCLGRDNVLWLQPAAPSIDNMREYEHRDLRIIQLSTEASQDELRSAKAVIKEVELRGKGEFRAWTETSGRDAITHGLLIVLPVVEQEFNELITYVKDLPRPASYRVVDKNHPSAAAEAIARFPVGAYANSELRVESTFTGLSPEELILIRRAFADCSSVRLDLLADGLSGRSFRAYARLNDAHLGSRRPLPFFVKFDEVSRIAKELSNYRRLVESFIPFSQRPRLAENRTLLGYERGILVGAFVEQTEEFHKCLSRGDIAPIGSLFDEAFRGWRLQAFHDKDFLPFADTAKASIWQSLTTELYVGDASPVLSISKIRPEVVEEARRNGAVLEPDQFQDALNTLPAIPHRRGPIHGDLHPGNVFVHSDQAIVIDFEKTRVGPLSFDAATLETALAFDVRYDSSDYATWMKTISQLYAAESIAAAPGPAEYPDSREWIWSAIRQIRVLTLANCLSEKEYPAALAVALLRRACFKPGNIEQLKRAAYGYQLASSLISLAQ